MYCKPGEATQALAKHVDRVENVSPRPWETCSMFHFRGHTQSADRESGLPSDTRHVPASLVHSLTCLTFPPPAAPLRPCPATAAVLPALLLLEPPEGTLPLPALRTGCASLSGWGQMSKLCSVCLTQETQLARDPACATSDLPNCLFTSQDPRTHKPQRPAVRQKRGFQIHFLSFIHLASGTEQPLL